MTTTIDGVTQGVHVADALGIVEFTEDLCPSGPCTAVLTTQSGLEIGPIVCDVEAVTAQTCSEPWNEAWGFYDGSVLVGYVEFREGLYYTPGWASFGQGYETKRVCDVGDWGAVRTEFGVPLDLCVHTLTGLQHCGP